MRLCIAFGVCAAGSNAGAQAAKAGAWVKATVLTDGAAVYEKPDFDSTVQDYIKLKTSLYVSRRPFAGLGGLGLFHKVSYNKKTGYMADTDIKVGGAAEPSVAADGGAAAKTPGKRKKKKKDSWNDDGSKMKEPVFLTRFLGFSVTMADYTEIYQSHKLNASMTFYGVRWSGPGTLGLSLPLDFNLGVAFTPPSYLKVFNGGLGKGYTVFGDIALQLPAVNLDDWMVTYGIGMVYVYTNYQIPVRKANSTQVVTFPSSDFRLGVDFGLGLGTRIKKVLVRADLKYYIERASYLGAMGSAQLEF